MSGDTSGWFSGARRVLFVHAHPDDETIATGGTLAALAESGASPAVVTLTRGERGEVNPGPFNTLAGTAELAVHRERELDAALFFLGVDHHAYLGTPPALAGGQHPRRYTDSGMAWGPGGLAVAAPDAPPDALTRAAVVDPLADLLALADAWQTEAIVSYDAIGGYGHPDHVFAHRLGRAVARGLDLPFWEIVTERGAADPRANANEATPDDGDAGQPVEAYDVSAWLERKTAALRAYTTQVTVHEDTLVHVGGQSERIATVERYRRLPHPQ